MIEGNGVLIRQELCIKSTVSVSLAKLGHLVRCGISSYNKLCRVNACVGVSIVSDRTRIETVNVVVGISGLSCTITCKVLSGKRICTSRFKIVSNAVLIIESKQISIGSRVNNAGTGGCEAVYVGTLNGYLVNLRIPLCNKRHITNGILNLDNLVAKIIVPATEVITGYGFKIHKCEVTRYVEVIVVYVGRAFKILISNGILNDILLTVNGVVALSKLCNYRVINFADEIIRIVCLLIIPLGNICISSSGFGRLLPIIGIRPLCNKSYSSDIGSGKIILRDGSISDVPTKEVLVKLIARITVNTVVFNNVLYII